MKAQAFPIRRNSVLLAAGLAASGGMLQVAVAVGTTTLVLVTGVKSIVGLGPAIFLSTAALAALPAGRAMDRFGRMKVISGGFVTGIVATSTVALGCHWDSTPLVVLGLALVGASSGTVILSRAAAADMYPPERRARGISLVLFGAVFGALLGPLVFVPLFGKDQLTDTDALVLPWFVASAIMVVGLAISLTVRPDPKRIGEALGYGAEGETETRDAAPLGHDPAPAGCCAGSRRGGGELLGDGVGDDAVGLHRRRPRPQHRRHVLGHQRPYRGYVRARARRG